MAAATCLVPSLVAAQSLGLDPERDEPRWLRAWSPLEWRTNLARRLPAAGSEFSEDSTRSGEFWTAGNPAGLVRELGPARTDFAFAWSRQEGEYRRPLDPGAARLLQLRARSWQRVTPAFALIGNVVADQEHLDPGTLSDQTEPHGSSPFVMTDTSGAGMRRTRVRLEGAGGWQLGAWGLGLAIGLETRENLTLESGLVRRARSATPGTVLGVSRQLGRASFGVYGKYRYRNETIRLSENSEEGRVYPLEGYREPDPLDILTGYYRRLEESAASAGLSGRVLFAGGTGAAFIEARWLDERQTSQELGNPAEDGWNASGWSGGISWQRPLGSRWQLELSGDGELLSGDGDATFDESAVFFTAEERRIVARFGVRYRAGEWRAGLGAGVRHERRERVDSSAAISSIISATSPVLEGQIGRRFGRFGVSISGSMLVYSPTSAIPSPSSQGPKYQQLIAPELDLYAMSSRPVTLGARVEWSLSSSSVLWLRVRTERVAPTQGPVTAVSPGGSRRATAIEFGMSM